MRHATIGRRPRATATILTLTLAVGLGACSSGSDSPPAGGESGGGSPEAGDGVTDDFQQQNMLVTAVCSPDPVGGGVVQVDGWNPESWERLAHTEFRLPPAVFTVDAEGQNGPRSAMEELCEQDSSFSRWDVAAIRSLFDQDFTKIAVVIWDQDVNSYHVGYVDRSGELTDLTGTEDFGLTPKEEAAALSADGGTVYFSIRGDDQNEFRVGGRPVEGSDQPKYVWSGDRDSGGEYVEGHYLTPVGTPSSVVVGSGYGARLSPSGQRLLIDGYVLDRPAETTVITPSVWQEEGTQVTCGFDWVDDDTLLCDENSGASASPATVDLGAGAERGEDILPPNDRDNDYMVVSLDGRQFAFRSRQGSETSYYVAETQPGSAPTMIPLDSEFVTLGGNAWFIDWF